MKRILIPLLTIFISSTSLMADQMNQVNNPFLMKLSTEKEFKLNIKELPTTGKSNNQGWSSDYWPTIGRGIAKMWQGDFTIPAKKAWFERKGKFNERVERLEAINKDLDNLIHLTKKDIKRMSMEERRKLPPAVKLDIVNDNYDFPLTKAELDRTRSIAKRYKRYEENYIEAYNKRDEAGMEKAEKDMNSINWFGLCHGWAPATIREKSPEPCTLAAKKFAPKIPFGAGDIQALVSLLYADYSGEPEEVSCGSRCNLNIEDDEINRHLINSNHIFKDINPGAFHVILANKLGINKNGFILEVDPKSPVWNQGVVEFKSEYEDVNFFQIQKMKWDGLILDDGDGVSSDTKRQVLVTTKAKYIKEVAPYFEKSAAPEDIYTTVTYKYLLELDKDENIIGGRWYGESNKNHPDFVWDMAQVDPLNESAQELFGEGMLKVMKASSMR